MTQELVECRYYESAEDYAQCQLCPWHCRIRPGKIGRCHVRENVDGVLRSLNYAEVTSVAMDPVEKKPLYHFYPGSDILSLGTFGCNLSCIFCQNWTISQGRPPTQHLAPQQALELAEQWRAKAGNIGIAYTYNEPIIWYEYVYDTARLVQEAGMHNVLVTNGIIEEEPLRELLPYVGAMNVDIKAWHDDFYRKLCGGEAWPARRTVEIAVERCHVEITVLIIPGYNDSDEELTMVFDWAASVREDMPVHLSRYHPSHKLDAPPTPAQTLQHAYELAQQRLKHVYVGNIELARTTDTRCPECGETLIRRSGFASFNDNLTDDGRCGSCGAGLNIVT